MSTVALNFVGGIPFQLLYDGIKIAIRRTSKFRSNLINLQFTLDCLQSRIIEQIGENNVELNLPNNIIEGIQTKMNEGVALVTMLSELRVWSIRIWGNCYNCIGPDCAEQLDELDRSLRSLLDQLELEQRRNVTRLMILAINARDKQDELEKRQLDILKGQQQILGMLMEQHHAIGKIVSSRVQIASSTGGGGTAPALGLVFQLLFDAVTQVRVKNEMVKRLLRRFKSTLNYLQPLIEEVAKSKRVLHLSEQEVEMFISEVENGVELIHKCSKVSKRVNYKKYKYTNKILDLDKSLQRLFFELKGQVEWHLKEAINSVNTIEAVIKKIEGGADQQKSELNSESQSAVPQPGSFAIGLDILDEQGHRDMKDTLVGSARNVEVVRPIEGSDAVQNQMETKSSCEVIPSPAGGLDVLNLQGPIDMEGIEADDLERKVQETTGAYVKGTLDFEINVEKMGLMGVKKIGGDQDIEIAVSETEPLSPAAQLDVLEEVHGTRDAKVTLEIPYIIEAITTAEPSSSSAEVRMKLDSSAFPSSSPSCSRAELKLPEKEKVIEEADQVLRPSSSFLTIGSSLGIQALEPSSLSLVFTKRLFLPIFTETKISDEDNNQIQILVVDKNLISGSHQMAPISLPHPVKLEIVVLNGDFGDRENWTRQEFDSKVVKERTGKRPLLTGGVSVTLRDGFATIGDIKFTDNSSWIRGRKFRIGARVAPGYQGPRIREAMTDAFVVKDGLGLARAAYNKHYPPMLEDEVWRLEKIGKYGAFHKSLAAENIHTVEDFLKMSVVDQVKLKKILGFGMSERMWEATLKHARTCEMGNKMYVRKAHANWSSLEAADTMLNEAALIRQDHRDMMNKETQVDSARIVKVIEEADQVLRPSSSFLTIGSSLGIQALEPSSLSLVFTKRLFLPIFTETKISDEDNNQIQILVVDKNLISGSHQMAPISLPHPVKLEIVVLNGDFGDRENWTRQEFDSKVVKERTGKRPLLTGGVSVTLRDGFATIGDIKFTDNSSWIRGRKFRIGARVSPGYQGPRIREAMTDAFVVKDGPGLVHAAYNKHYPPMLEDEVWRLEKIGKYGAFHKSFSHANWSSWEAGDTMLNEAALISQVRAWGYDEQGDPDGLGKDCEGGETCYCRD